MPHSTGGGSSSGGSHSSSHSSSRGGGSSQPKHVSVYNSYHPGYRPYVFYDRQTKQPKMIYADKSIAELNAEAEQNKKKKKSAPIVLGMIILVFIMYAVFSCFHFRQKVTGTSESDIRIVDNLGLFDVKDEENLIKTMQNFYSKTGIPMTIVTDLNSSWNNKFHDAETYAYSLYTMTFDDEKHYLILYTAENDSQSGDEEWFFEGMIGDDTENAFWESEYDPFTEKLQKCFYRAWGNECEAGYELAKVINDTVDGMEKVSFEPSRAEGCILTMLMLMTIIIPSFLNIMSLPTTTYDGYVPAAGKDSRESDKPVAVHCEYCNGVYYVGSVVQCPYCAAPAITSEDYSKSHGGA